MFRAPILSPWWHSGLQNSQHPLHLWSQKVPSAIPQPQSPFLFVCLKDFFKPKLLAGHDSGTIGFPIETQNKIWISKYSPKLMRIICHKSAGANLTLQGISVGRTLSAEGTPAVNTDHPPPVHEQRWGSTGLQEGKLPSFPKGNKETTCVQLKWWKSHNILVIPVLHDVFQSGIATQARNSLALG